MQFQLFIFLKSLCLRRNFHGGLLSFRVFSADGHYGLIAGRKKAYIKAPWLTVSPRMNTIASRDQFKPLRIGENLVVNYN